MQIEPLTGVWVVIRSDGSPITQTISDIERVSVHLFCKGGQQWEHYKAAGYKCIQVDIEFKPTKP